MTLRPDAAPVIHPTAVVGPDVRLAAGVTVGPYCVVEGTVSVGPGTAVGAHTVVRGTTVVGSHCRLGPFATIGGDPQHAGYDGRETHLVLGERVVVREYASVHRATRPGPDAATRVGDGCLLMAGSHVAHDCRLADGVTLASAVQLGGHVTVGPRAFIGGGTVLHQFIRVGRLAVVGGGEAISKDVLPFGAVLERRHKGYNAVGCRRAGLPGPTLRALRAAFHTIHNHRSPVQAAAALRRAAAYADVAEVRELVAFIDATVRGIQPSARGEALAAAAVAAVVT